MGSVTIVSVLRLQSLIYFGNSTNPTWYLWPVAYWSTIEVNVGMMCTCLPAMRLILLRLFPQYLGSGTTKQSASYGGYVRSQSRVPTKVSEYKHNDQHSEVELTGNPTLTRTSKILCLLDFTLRVVANFVSDSESKFSV